MYYNPIFDLKTIDKELSKLQKINYNKFRWWRGWQEYHTPLPNKAPFIDKIPSQVQLQLPKLKKVGKSTPPKIKLPKLKKVTSEVTV